MEEKEKIPANKTSVIMMAVIIMMFIVGILTRWDYIKKEVTETFERMFPQEQTGSGSGSESGSGSGSNS